ncbi:hypothetical protein C9374_004483 [Naegleria lovaniensis]|uniref:Uncharacterized protein n=1 Tax=Naegleria lovaniensis TaxID=51637 RepID=A0AA88GLF0_NAELO|nr:uncharacterized protein C9374_004483 [Naegleria lovaniensis]KAG2383146.1 hypothetical protein C9374_004483 [Naegleria lovaniensis]
MNPPMKLASNHVVVVVMILGLFLSVATHSFEVVVSSTSEPVQVNKVLLPSSPTSVLTHDTLQTKASYASACDCPTCTPIVMEPKTYVYLNVSCPSNTFARYKRMSVGSTNPNDYFTTTTIETSEQYAFETGNPYMYYIYLSKKNSSCFAVEDVILPVTKTLTYVQCNNLLNANCSLLFNYNYVCMKVIDSGRS